MLLVWLTCVAGVFLGCFSRVAHVLLVCSTCVGGVLQVCCRHVARVFQLCCRRVVGVLQALCVLTCRFQESVWVFLFQAGNNFNVRMSSYSELVHCPLLWLVDVLGWSMVHSQRSVCNQNTTETVKSSSSCLLKAWSTNVLVLLNFIVLLLQDVWGGAPPPPDFLFALLLSLEHPEASPVRRSRFSLCKNVSTVTLQNHANVPLKLSCCQPIMRQADSVLSSKCLLTFAAFHLIRALWLSVLCMQLHHVELCVFYLMWQFSWFTSHGVSAVHQQIYNIIEPSSVVSSSSSTVCL